MSNHEISVKLRGIFLAEAGIEITDENANLFSPPYMLSPRQMAGIFIIIKESFKADLNKLIPRTKSFTLAQIASALTEIKSDNAQDYI